MSLLQHEPGITYYPTLAKRTSVNAAILAQQIYFWQCKAGVGVMHEGQRWIYNSYEDWSEQLGMSIERVRGAVKLLESQGILISQKLKAKSYDHTKYYRIDPTHEVFRLPSVESPTSSGENQTTEYRVFPDQSSSIPNSLKTEITSEITTENTTDPKAFHPVPRGTGGASKAAGKSAIGRREPTEAELALLPCFEACQQAIAKARDDLGLSPATQERDRALIVLEQTTRLNGYSAEQIQRACEWCFGPDCPSREFNLGNLSFIHRWRKKWANGLAVVCMIDKYNRRQTADNRPKLYTPEVVAPQYVFPNRQLGVIKL